MDFTALLESEGIEIPPPVITMELVPLDYTTELTKARAMFEAFRGECREMEERARAHKVIDEPSSMVSVEMGTLAQGLIKKITVKMSAIIEEPNDFVRTVRGIAKSLIEPLEAVKSECGRKRDGWLMEERKRKAELQARAEREARELQDRLNREARAKAEAEAKRLAEEEAERRHVPVEQVKVVIPMVEEVVIFEPVVEQPATTVRAESGSGTAYQKTGKPAFRLIEPWEENIHKVPAKYLMLNTKEINNAIKAGVRDIPGLEYFLEDAKTVFKSR